MKIFKAIFTHKDWPHVKCAYMPCTDMDMAKKRVKELNEDLKAEHCKIVFLKDI